MGLFISVDQQHPSATALERAASILANDGVVVIPTDSVYGIACAATPDNPAHERIFAIKRRDRSQTLPLLVDGRALESLAEDVPDWAHGLAERYWPGALTLVVRASSAVPREYLAEDGTIALRMPDSELVLDLISRLGVPLATTSANIHGAPAAASSSGLDARVVSAADLTLDSGSAPIGIASTIVDCTGEHPRILREGAISKKDILAAC
ncbi:MAG: threonylcarbamoyl-AMP synthase [Atopobiaceae bacterium]|nr:threonylcarbamoyl-AMP synthase [Atopobiaceae bacterium]